MQQSYEINIEHWDATDIAIHLKLAYSTVKNHVTGSREFLLLKGFPAPVSDPGCTQRWLAIDVIEWALSRRTFKPFLTQVAPDDDMQSSVSLSKNISTRKRSPGRPQKIQRAERGAL